MIQVQHAAYSLGKIHLLSGPAEEKIFNPPPLLEEGFMKLIIIVDMDFIGCIDKMAAQQSTSSPLNNVDYEMNMRHVAVRKLN